MIIMEMGRQLTYSHRAIERFKGIELDWEDLNSWTSGTQSMGSSDKDENILCSQKVAWRETCSRFEMASQHK